MPASSFWNPSNKQTVALILILIENKPQVCLKSMPFALFGFQKKAFVVCSLVSIA